MSAKEKKVSALEKLKAELAESVPIYSDDIEVSQYDDTEISKPARPEKKRLQSSWYAPDKSYLRQINQLMLDEDVSMNDLILEGLEMVFAKRGRVLKK